MQEPETTPRYARADASSRDPRDRTGGDPRTRAGGRAACADAGGREGGPAPAEAGCVAVHADPGAEVTYFR